MDRDPHLRAVGRARKGARRVAEDREDLERRAAEGGARAVGVEYPDVGAADALVATEPTAAPDKPSAQPQAAGTAAGDGGRWVHVPG